MKVKVGDNVKVIAGSNRGKTGKVLKTFKLKNRVIVEGVNIVKKHQKPTRTNESGGIIERENPIHVSNVQVIESVKKEKTVKTVKAEKPIAKKETKAKKAVK